MNADSHNSRRGERCGKRLFWVTREGALIALLAVHAAALVAVAVEYFHPLSTGDHGAERVPALDFIASYALYGFVACVILVLLGRALRRLVMRAENYYEGGRR